MVLLVDKPKQGCWPQVVTESPGELNNPPLVYDLNVDWEDGSTTKQFHLERPTLLVRKGKPTHLFFGTSEGTQGYASITDSRNIVIPINTN